MNQPLTLTKQSPTYLHHTFNPKPYTPTTPTNHQTICRRSPMLNHHRHIQIHHRYPHPHHSLVSICITTHHTNPSYIHTIHTLSHHITLTPLPQEAKRLLVELELRAATTQLNLVSLQSALAAAEATKGVDEDAVKAAEVAVQQLVRSCHTITRCATVKFEVTRRVT